MKIRRPSHATVVAYLALFVALGGSAVAVSRVGTNDLKNNAVTSQKIRNGSVGAKDLKALRIRTREIKASPIPGFGSANVSCGKREQILSGAGGWISEGSVTSTAIGGGGFGVDGTNPNVGGPMFVQAVCLRK